MRVRVDLGPRAHADPDETGPGWPLEPERHAAVVIDVLRATTTLTVALAKGAARVVPVADPAAAFEWKRRDPSVLLCGERGGLKIPGFDLGNSPAEYTFQTVSGRTLVFASTNGSRAMLASAECGVRRLGAFVNASAVAAAVADQPFVRLVCAGREGAFSLEDAACAGWLCEALAARGARIDGGRARLAMALAPRAAAEARTLLEGSAHGRALRALGPAFAADVEFCAGLDRVDRAFEF